MKSVTPTKAPNPAALFADKGEAQRIVAEQNARMGVVLSTNATHEGVRARMRALGIRAEDNIFSYGIIAARDED